MHLKIAALALTALAAAAPVAAQDFASIEIETIPVAEGLYMLVGAGGNLSLSVGADGAFRWAGAS